MTSDKIDLSSGPGFRPVEALLAHLHFGRSFLAGPHKDDDILKMRWYANAEGKLLGKVWWGQGAQGPPGHAHGGSMAAVLDEALGSVCWVAGHPVVAAELNTTFCALLPLGRTYTVEAWINRVDGRKIYPSGHIRDEEGTIYSTATGLFIEMKEGQFKGLSDKFLTPNDED